jgi:hypothetical protein
LIQEALHNFGGGEIILVHIDQIYFSLHRAQIDICYNGSSHKKPISLPPKINEDLQIYLKNFFDLTDIL